MAGFSHSRVHHRDAAPLIPCSCLPLGPVDDLKSLLPLLRGLQVVVLAGQCAQRGWQRHLERMRDVTTIDVPHPSTLAMTQPGKRNALLAGVQRAKALGG